MSESHLKKISEKLDLIISLLKIQNEDKIHELRKSIQDDVVSSKIIELAKGTMTYTELKTKVAQETNVAEITVRRRISELADKGIISGTKVGREVYYDNAGIIEGG
ncbi:MAG: winged helix-turn-helix domain-containing protein [Candidatus Hodarchaeales archaeon]